MLTIVLMVVAGTVFVLGFLLGDQCRKRERTARERRASAARRERSARMGRLNP